MVRLAPANAPLLTGTESLAMVLPEGFISSHHKATSSILLVRAKFQSEFLDSSVDLVLAGTLVYPPGLCGFAASC